MNKKLSLGIIYFGLVTLNLSCMDNHMPATPQFMRTEKSQNLVIEEAINWQDTKIALEKLFDIAKEIARIFQEEADSCKKIVDEECKGTTFTTMHARRIIVAGSLKAAQQDKRFVELRNKLHSDVRKPLKKELNQLRITYLNNNSNQDNYKFENSNQALSGITKYCNALTILIQQTLENAIQKAQELEK